MRRAPGFFFFQAEDGIRDGRVTGVQTCALSMLGWCIGGTLSLLYCALHEDNPVRNLLLLTTPLDTSGSLYFNWTARDSFDVDPVSEGYGSVPGRSIDWANKLMKPVTNYWTRSGRLWKNMGAWGGALRRGPYRGVARGVANNPPFPGKAYREWITFMYKENRLVRERMRIRGK